MTLLPRPRDPRGYSPRAGLTYIGLGMAVAYPATIIWCYSSAERRPAMLDAQACDGAWGVSGYVLFLQAWSVAIFLFVAGAAAYLKIIATSGRFVRADAVAVLAALALVVGMRLVWNGMEIRLEYQRQLAKLGTTWGEIQAAKPPADRRAAF